MLVSQNLNYLCSFLFSEKINFFVLLPCYDYFKLKTKVNDGIFFLLDLFSSIVRAQTTKP